MRDRYRQPPFGFMTGFRQGLSMLLGALGGGTAVAFDPGRLPPPKEALAGDWRAVGDDMRRAMGIRDSN